MKRVLLSTVLWLLGVFPAASFAHALEIATLTIVPDGNGFQVNARFHDRVLADSTLVIPPPRCRRAAPGRATHQADGSQLMSWRIDCAGPLSAESELTLSGPLAGVFTELEGEPAFRAASHGIIRVPLAAVVEDAFAVLGQYLRLGVIHILGGYDHLLFVLGLLMLVGGRRELILVISSFTVAHSITLTCAVLGWARMAAAPVEALIALSVAMVARDALLVGRAPAGVPRARSSWPYAFVFGLFHGFGFAGALSEIGFPADYLPVALIAFNVGVELGQLAVVACALLGAAFARRLQWSWIDRMRPVLASGIGVIASVWFVQRMDSLL